MAGSSRFNVFLTVLLFVLAVVVLTGAVMTATNYLQTRRAASQVAARALDDVVQRTSGEVVSFFGGANLLVDLYSTNPRVTAGGREIELLLPSLFRALRRTPQVADIYGGYENGDFWEVFSFSQGDGALVSQVGGPKNARFALRTIAAAPDGVRHEAWRFFDDAMQESVAPISVSPEYDPRQRVWYQDGRARGGEFVRTAPYVFSVAMRTGLTIAKSFDGAARGVVAVDVTLDRLSRFLNSIRPTPQHRIMMFDPTGGLLATSSDDLAPSTPMAKITDFKDPAVQAATALFSRKGPYEMEAVQVAGEAFLASVSRLAEPDLHNEGDLILNAAPRSNFEGTLAGATTRSIVSGLVVILLALPGIIYLARRVSKPLDDLANNARLIQAILDTIPNPVFYKGPDSRFLGCNGAYETWFRTARRDIAGKRLVDLEHLAEEDRASYQAEDEKVIAEGSSLRREQVSVFADGQRRQTLYHVNGFRQGDGSPGGLVGTLVDITELKAAQEAMAKAKELAEAATRAKADFLASMSHEIRTPLNGITGMAELLAQSRLDDDQKHMLRTIRESGNSLMRVINDILDFSKIEAGKLGIEQIPMSIADALEGVAITLTPGATQKGIRIHAFVDPEIPSAVAGDPGRLRQILFNLTGNAVKFSEKHDVMLRATRLSGDTSVINVRFDVIDHGIGIPEESQGRLFQAFSQAEASTTRRFGGTGLGLAICKRLVDLMNGRIGFTSTFGKGSTFFAEFPFNCVPAAPGPEPTQDLSQLRVLLIGGHAERARAIQSYASHWGAEYALAVDEGEALEMCARARDDNRPFEILIVDLDLDGERQREMIVRLRERHDTRKYPLVILQDYHDRSARIQEADLVSVDANPLVRHRVISAIAVAAGRASPEVRREEEDAPAAVNAPTIDEALERGQLILLVEDNRTNQDVIGRQLRRLGYACEIANNGAEAVKAWQRGRYGLILTDCHMPEMDGYEMTGRVRAAERALGGHIPIIAITASALAGEADRCLAAGMDDYLTKPITFQALGGALRKWMPLREGRATAPKASAPVRDHAGPVNGAGTAVDETVLKTMFGDDDATFREILSSFVEPSEDIIRNIAVASKSEDSDGVKDGAHQLKSAARSIGATVLADTCVALEAAAMSSDWNLMTALIPRVEEQMLQVTTYIREL